MEENMNINPENETVSEPETENMPENTEAAKAEALPEKGKKEKKEKKEKKPKKPKKPKMIRNQSLFKRGGYAVAITAAFLAGIIIVNVLVGVLSKRFVLDFDMSFEKQNSMSSENIDYIKSLKNDVTITMCALKDGYTGGYMQQYAQSYSVTEDASDYYKQTVKLLDKYASYSDKVTLKYVDTQSSEFTAISSEYSNEKLHYGDIIVSSGKDAAKKYKIVGFEDIYKLTEDSTYASYGYTTSKVTGNNVETAVTSAIAYVTSTKSKKVALLTGHSATDYTDDYQTLLKANNYDIKVVSDSIINNIPSDYDAIIIAAPNKDFIGSELDAISEFLDNNGKLGKGLLFFADASAPYLKNLYDFLSEWGITVGEGILFETNSQNYMPDDPTTMGIYATQNDKITSGMKLCIAGLNVPITAAFENEGDIKVTSLMDTLDSVVAAPVGTAKNWTGADKYTKQVYSGVLQSVKSDFDDDNNEIKSNVMAFSSVEYIKSSYNEQTSVSNKNITLACAERSVGAEDTGISFISKTITNESFADSVSQSSSTLIRIIFMFVLPILSIAAGIYIYIRRKNA